ncbi:hypothetical protein [uncultured Coprobacter sp.]|uniref:hypothetical protein n=1 Tax=uncultured Coprobacter sp. TaxID=1720550 RepID=UPI00259375D3|nr:hypothetical protein [uncultured Coprobacter sp.]
MKMKFLYLIGIMLIGGLLVSCDKDSEDEKNETEDTSFLIGTWQQVSNSGWIKQGEYVDEWNNSYGEEGGRIVFNEDGTCKFYMYEDGAFVEDAFGTWEYKSGKICVWDSDSESVSTVKDLSASTLTMEMYEKETENEVVTYEFYEIDTYHKITNNLN